jgi:hypothetical protein
MRNLAFLVSGWVSLCGMASEESQGPLAPLSFPSMDTEIFWGRCEISTQPHDPLSQLQFCIKPSLDEDGLTDFHANRNWHQVGRLYTGAHYRGHSLHYEGFLHQAFSLDGKGYEVDRQTYLFAYQMGNHTVDHWVLTLGKKFLPFGLHFNPIQGAYYQYSNEQFWQQGPTLGATLSWDNWEHLRVEMGAAGETHSTVAPKGKEWHGVAARVIYDFSDLSGTRMIASVEGENIGTRKVGFALVHNAKDSLVQFEWVRQQNLQEGANAEYAQLFRFSVTGPYKSGTRTVFLYEDVHLSSRMGILLQEWKVFFPLYYHAAVGYRKDESGGRENRWFIFTGVTTHL